MRLLVTGGTGFIGSHLAEAGRRRGAEVVVLGLTDRPEEQANVELLRRQGVEVLPGSITDAELCRRAVRGATHVFHLAVAMREGAKQRRVLRVDQSGRHPAPARGVTRSAASQRFVYCSTIGIYGHRAPGITTRGARRSRRATSTSGPRSRPSGWCGSSAAERGLPVVDPPAGRRLRTARPAAAQAVQGRGQGRFPLFGSGSGRRHMVYVDDVVSGFFRACERDEALGRVGSSSRGRRSAPCGS